MKILIIGGGLSGLALAEALETRGRDYMLVEARARYGGRIQTEHYRNGFFDMGPAWFWPDQPRIAALIDRLGLETFGQYSDGNLTFQNEDGQVLHGRGAALMDGSWRLKRGFGELTRTLAGRLPEDRKRLNARVTGLTRTDTGITATLGSGGTLRADNVVLALPPRVAAQIDFAPSLPPDAIQSMLGIATWMAGQAKALAVYDRAFWREAGLSGDAISRSGPMVEIHDASAADDGPFALFGFIGVPPHMRADEAVLRERLKAQLGHLFGAEAAAPAKLYVKDWALDPHTSTKADMKPVHAHPVYAMPNALEGLWGGRLHFAGSEVAPQFGGYIEGALAAAENVFRGLEAQAAVTG